MYRLSMTTVNTCKAMIHVGLVFPLRAWLYGNIKCEDLIFFSFLFAYCFSVLQKCAVLWIFKCNSKSYCGFLCSIKTCSSPVLKCTVMLSFNGFIYTKHKSCTVLGELLRKCVSIINDKTLNIEYSLSSVAKCNLNY